MTVIPIKIPIREEMMASPKDIEMQMLAAWSLLSSISNSCGTANSIGKMKAIEMADKILVIRAAK